MPLVPGVRGQSEDLEQLGELGRIYEVRDPSSASASQDASDSPIGTYPRCSYSRRARALSSSTPSLSRRTPRSIARASSSRISSAASPTPSTCGWVAICQTVPAPGSLAKSMPPLQTARPSAFTTRYSTSPVSTRCSCSGDVLEVCRASRPGNALDIASDRAASPRVALTRSGSHRAKRRSRSVPRGQSFSSAAPHAFGTAPSACRHV